MSESVPLEVAHYLREARHPGGVLKEFVLSYLDLSVSQAARDLGVSRQTLHRIFDASASVTPEMAVRLEALCGISAMFWLELQCAYELGNARSSLAQLLPHIPQYRLPNKVMKKLGATDGR
ncbi:HigA family addiction module antitoxin [Caballeronia sp. LZ035]|uniref:HigA family addiction module antitoxin n=1 Tax=Caballeronia sp. LZ035 TaxID=3038568 RepID=UPI0028601A90|nr:HigA family addiction module antitoxin [Caballeronia sp. LZ035]MDR5762964.1 HigA family addiction module antitoxin [Caballeronia sp. LZ035]